MYNTQPINAIKDYMVARNHTLAVAESVTAGHVQASLSLAAEASKFFQGGITTYNLGQKARHLHVEPIHAAACNCVSQTVADQMAITALTLFASDWSLAITGYAAPLPQMGIQNLFAFYAIVFRGDVVCRARLESEDTGLYSVQRYFTDQLLIGLSNQLSHSG